MSADRNQTEPIKVQIVEERRAPAIITGIPQTYNPAANGIQQILGLVTRRRRAVVSVTGVGTVAFGRTPSDLQNGTTTATALFTAPANFEMQSSSAWWVGNVSGTALVSVIAETESDT